MRRGEKGGDKDLLLQGISDNETLSKIEKKRSAENGS
jgi:hypothetical protein